MGLLPPHGSHAAHHNAVQSLGDGSHLVLAQEQTEQPGESVQIPDRLPQKGPHLLHSPHQNIPELLLLLGAPAVSCCLKGSRQVLQTLRRPDLLQKGIQGLQLLQGVPRPCHGRLHPHQGQHPGLPAPVQVLQGGLVFQLPGQSQSPGMPVKGLPPGFSAQAPGNDIVLQPVTGRRVQGREGRFQIPQHRLPVQALYHCLQSGEHRVGGGLQKNILRSGKVGGNPVPAQNLAQNRLIPWEIPAHQGHIPVPHPGPGSAAKLRRHKHAFLPHRLQTGSPGVIRQARDGLQGPPQERPAHVTPGRSYIRIPETLLLGRNPGLGRQAQQRSRRLPGQLHPRGLGAWPIADQAHRHRGRLLNEMGQNSQLLGGEVRKSVYVKHMLPGKTPRFHLLQQLGHPVSGVLAKACTNPVVGLLQLLRQDALRLPGSCL